MYPLPAPPSTRTLTVTKWITVSVSVLLLGLGVLWVRQLHTNVEFLEAYRGALDDPAAAVADAERNVVIGYVTLAGVALIGVTALVAGFGQQWARVLCMLLLLGPMGVIVYGAVDGGADSLYALVFLVPFIALLVLWGLPGVTRGLAVKRSRRTYHALGVLCVPVVAAGLMMAAPTDATAATTLRAGYESGTVTSGTAIGLNKCCPHSIGVTTSVVRTGKYALRSHLEYGDPMAAGGTRAESHTMGMPETHFRSGDSAYYGFSVYLPSTWQNDSTEDIVFQWKPWRDACEADKAPSAFLTTRPSGTWRLRVNSDRGRCSTPDSVTKTSIDFAEIKPGQWHDFVFRFKWSHGGDGVTEVWHQTHKNPGWQKVTRNGPNTFNDDDTTFGYLKWGIYKPAWNTAPTNVTSRTVLHDNIAVGTSFDAVDPTVTR